MCMFRRFVVQYNLSIGPICSDKCSVARMNAIENECWENLHLQWSIRHTSNTKSLKWSRSYDLSQVKDCNPFLNVCKANNHATIAQNNREKRKNILVNVMPINNSDSNQCGYWYNSLSWKPAVFGRTCRKNNDWANEMEIYSNHYTDWR